MKLQFAFRSSSSSTVMTVGLVTVLASSVSLSPTMTRVVGAYPTEEIDGITMTTTTTTATTTVYDQPELSLMEEVFMPRKMEYHQFDPPVEVDQILSDKYNMLIPPPPPLSTSTSSTSLPSSGSDSGQRGLQDDGTTATGTESNNYGVGLAKGGAKCNKSIGMAAGEFRCHNIDITSFLTGTQLGSPYANPNNLDAVISPTFVGEVWGWTDHDDDGREYALVHMWDGTSIVDVTDPYRPLTVAFVETTGGVVDGLDSVPSRNIFRDIKVINDVMYVGSENRAHGIQSFDLRRLKGMARIDARRTEIELMKKSTSPSSSLSSSSFVTEGLNIPIVKPDDIIPMNSTHNLVVAEQANKLIAVGLWNNDNLCPRDRSTRLRGSLAVFDVSDPAKRLNPPLEACVRLPIARGYVHDAHCINYNGPDLAWRGRNICALFMEMTIVLFDLDNLVPIRDFSYPTASYVHQGWFSEDHRFLYTDDEWDEQDKTTGIQFGTTYTFDLSDFEAPEIPMTTFHTPPENSHVHVDHNLYIKDGFVYQAAYSAGARIRKIREDSSLEEVAYIDLENLCECVDGPADPTCACNSFFGTWTYYPGWEWSSGISAAGSTAQGLFLLKPDFQSIEKELLQGTTDSSK